MKKIAANSIFLSVIALTQLNYINKVNAFTVELFKSNDIVNSLEDADALIKGTNLDRTTSGSYKFIDFKDVAYGSWGHSDIDNLFPGIPGYPNTDNFAVRATAKIEIASAGNWTFLTTADDGVRLRINGANVIFENRLQADKDNLGTVYLPAGSHDLELVLFENDGEATLELWAAPGIQKNYNSNFKLVRDTLEGNTATNSALARRNIDRSATVAREKVGNDLILTRRNIQDSKKAVATAIPKHYRHTDIVLALVLGIVLGMILMLFLSIILFFVFMGWHKFYKKQHAVVNNSEIIKADSI